MTHKTLRFGLLAVAVAMAAASAGNLAQQDRRVERRQGVSIAQQVRPGDRSVTIVDETPPPLFVNPPEGVSFAEWLTEIGAIVFTGTVQQQRSQLTPEGDFIETRIVFQVEEVLSDPNGGIEPGSVVHFVLPGGDFNMNGVQVRGMLPWALRPRQKGRYLVYASRGDEGELLVLPSSMFELDGEGAPRRMAYVPFAAGFDDSPEQAVLNDIRSAALKRRQR